MSKCYAITGVASGIGAHLAAILKKQGHTVVGFDIQRTDSNVDHFIQLDLNDSYSINNAIQNIPSKLDGLCNNAGLPPRNGLESSILRVNFLAAREFTKGMLPHLSNGSSIVNMASRAGHGWKDNLDQIKRLSALQTLDQAQQFVDNENINATRCYNLSKEAMILWTMAMVEELIAKDIRANSLSPGGISTGILNDFKRAFGDKMTKNVVRAGRPGKPEEVASVAAFVLSPQSHWLKGADIPIDGGMGAFNLSDTLQLNDMKLS